jgi:hypothetical protein
MDKGIKLTDYKNLNSELSKRQPGELVVVVLLVVVVVVVVVVIVVVMELSKL